MESFDLNKAEIIHDDEKKPKWVYRIENDKGEGPYSHPKTKHVTAIGESKHKDDNGLSHNHPHPGTDLKDKVTVPRFRLPGDKAKHEGKNVLFGFEHEHHAREWFSDTGKRRLREKGYKLRRVPAAKVIRSNSGRQIAFIPHHSYKPGKHSEVPVDGPSVGINLKKAELEEIENLLLNGEIKSEALDMLKNIIEKAESLVKLEQINNEPPRFTRGDLLQGPTETYYLYDEIQGEKHKLYPSDESGRMTSLYPIIISTKKLREFEVIRRRNA